MIQLDKQTTPITDEKGEITGWNTQAVLLPNHFFLDPGLTFDWVNNTCTLDGNVYYLDKSLMKNSTAATIPSESEWLDTYGNRIEHELYDFVDMEGNPSGNFDNYYRTKYIDNRGRTKYIIEYTYDDRDNCLTQTSIAPEGAEADQEKIYVTLTKYGYANKKTVVKCVKGDTMLVAALPTYPNARFAGWKLNGVVLPTNEKGAYIVVMNESCEINAYYIYTYIVYLVDRGTLVYQYGVEETSPVLPTYTVKDSEEDYFDGWLYNGEKLTEPVYIEKNTTFTAIRKPWLRMRISSTDGDSYPDTKFKEGGLLTYAMLDYIIPSGSQKQQGGATITFDGWYLEGSRITEDFSLEVSADFDITAKWI